MEKRKSIATVTWISYRNAGTYLQAYALQKVLQSLGYDSRIIDDSKVLKSYPEKRFSPIRFLRSLKPSAIRFRRADRKAAAEYQMFRNLHLDIDSDWTYPSDLSQKYDTYIAGSDQIWSPTTRFDGFYYLDFTSRHKIAYAPSFGVSDYPESRKTLVAPLLAEFSSISVREKMGAEILKSKFGIDAEVVVDPTLLLTREEWVAGLQLSSPGMSGKPYILCYLLTYNSLYIDFVKRYAKAAGLELKLVVHSAAMTGITEDELYVGPSGFVDAIGGADIVMTDSYHGTIFSMIFQKEFYAFRRFSDNSSESQNSRLESLLGQVGLLNRCLSQDSLDINNSADIDYTQVEARLAEMRENSMNYLKKALSEDGVGQRIAYSAYAKTVGVRKNAASGGAAFALAKSFLKKGGVVYGCAQDHGVKIQYIRVDKEEDLGCLAGSKYVYCQASHVFGQIENDLVAGRDVLFIGLPCQVAGVRSQFRDMSEHLYTVDLCCHGAPSGSMLDAHLDTLNMTLKADKVSFRKKDAGGVKYGFTVMDNDGNIIYDRHAFKDWYMTGFLSGLLFRRCCFKCPFASTERCSDLTLADHWAMGKSPDPEMNVGKGLSTVLINTEKGSSLFCNATEYLEYEQRPLSEAFRNGRFIKPSDKPADYDEFMACLDKYGYRTACRKYLPSYMFGLRIHELKSRYYKSPVRQFLRKLYFK